MFAELLDSAREVRGPLTVGYSVFFTFWLTLGDRIHDAFVGDSPLQDQLTRLAEWLAPAGELALVSVAAYMVGSAISNLCVNRLVGVIQSRWVSDEWDLYIELARDSAASYETYRVKVAKLQEGKHPVSNDTYTVPSPLYAAHLFSEAAQRSKRRSEVDYRIVLGLSLVPPSVALAWLGGGWWYLTLLGPLLLAVDVAFMSHRVRSEMFEHQRDTFREELERLNSNLTMHQRNATAGKTEEQKRKASDDAEKAKADIVLKEAEIAAIEARFARRGSRLLGQIMSHEGPTEIYYDWNGVPRRRRRGVTGSDEPAT